MTDEKQRLSFGTFGPQLSSLYEAVVNKLRLEWPKALNHEGASFLLRGQVAVSRVTYKTVVHLCADNPIAEGRRPEYALSSTPLIRTLLDALFNLVFLLDDLDKRKEHFFRGGWREIKEEFERLNTAYADDEEWATWLSDFAAFIERGRIEFGITDEEAAQSRKTLPYWPTPGQMKKDTSLAPDRKAFLEFMEDWFYRALSSDSHLSMPGLARRAIPILEGHASLDDYRSECVFVAATLSLALLSEVQMTMRWPDLTPRFEYLWTILAEHWPDARNVYERRYKGNL